MEIYLIKGKVPQHAELSLKKWVLRARLRGFLLLLFLIKAFVSSWKLLLFPFENAALAQYNFYPE